MAVGEVSLALQQSVNGFLGNAALGIDQIVIDTGSTSLQLDQSVDYSVANITLAIQQSISQTGGIALGLSQNVYDPLVVVGSWVSWDVSVLIDGVDESANLIGRMEISCERSAARHAEFTLLMSGIINVHQFIGRQVVINYHQNNGAVWRRFSGKIDRAKYDPEPKTMRITCTDELQKVIDGHSNSELNALTGGYWSEHVFNKDNAGWDYLSDLLKTVNKSVELNSNLQLQINDYQNKIIPDYSFNESLILDITVDTPELNQLVNRVDIDCKFRWQRLFQRDTTINWTFPISFCDNFFNSVTFPSKSTATEAIQNADRHILGITYLPVWPGGIYNCSGQNVLFSNAFPDGIRGFYANTRFRWNQTVTQAINISVIAPDSITEYGNELLDSIRVSVDNEATLKDWGTSNDDYTAEPSGLISDGLGNHRVDDVDAGNIDGAMETVIAEAMTLIQSSHRKNFVVITLPLSPFLELNQTIESTDAEIPCKGVVNRITETYDFDSGEPITEVELAISKGGSGLDRADVTVASPGLLKLLVGEDKANIVQLPTLIGGKAGALEETESMRGMFLNINAPLAGTVTYSPHLEIQFDEINDGIRLNLDEQINYQINIAVPDNNLIINA